jgi:hypothetical protein
MEIEDTMNHLVGFFHVEGETTTQSVETPLTGVGAKDYAKLGELIRAKFPEVDPKSIMRTGSAIEKRTVAPRRVEYPVGATLKQLFNKEDAGDEECSLTVGTVNFNQQSCEVVFRYHRGKNTVGITLRERASRVPIRFSNLIKGMRLVKESEEIIKGVLGNDASELVLDLVEVRPPA